MFKNYFKIAFRNLWKNKIYSAINVVGLSIGMAVCMLILLFVFYETSFDDFHSKNIYRLNEVQKFEGMVASQKVALSMFPMGPTLKDEFPEIKNFTRINWRQKMPLTYNEKKVFFPQLLFVDSTFLEIFDFKLIRGNRKTVLEKPNSVVLTQSAVAKLFGGEDPVGKTVSHFGNDTTTFTVTGILENTPSNSQLQFDGLFSFNTIYRPDWMNMWGGNWLNTYFELAPGTSVQVLEKKFPAYLKKYMSNNDNWKNYELFLLPIRDVHANASDIGLDYLNFKKFDKKFTRLFSIIALIVLVIACVNFMNLSTARSSDRAKEVGIRKSIGAQRGELILQFIGETILLALIALLIAILIVQLLLPFVNKLSDRELSFPLFSDPTLMAVVLLGTICVGLISGLYPAFYLSAFHPITVLKGSVHTGKNKSTIRNILVVGQFASAIFLMIATIFVIRQLRYMQSRNPGFDREQVVTIRLDGTTYKKYDVLKQDLLANSMISGVTGAQDQLGSHLDQSGIEFKDEGPLRELTSTRLIVDPDYLKLYNIPIAAGRNFSSEESANGKEYIINEALAKELLKERPGANQSTLLGKRFGFDSLGRIVGIAKDFNFNSLHFKIETMFLFNQKNWGYSTVSVKINGNNTKAALEYIEATWRKINGDHPFEYMFLDEHFASVYRSDTQVSKVIGVLATIAIIISCLGLFGLASFAAEKRVKEVGIRKVLGASVQNITSLLSRDFLKLVLIANFIAWPVAWLALNRWLQDFAYRISISWWIFVLTGIVAILIALFTISFQAIKAAVSNPVKSLRTE